MYTATLYRYQLDGSRREAKRKINCPSCGGKKTFTRYRDYETGEYIDDTVGKCDRENRCTYHMTPKEWFALHPDQRAQSVLQKTFNVPAPKPPVHIPFKVLASSLKDYEENSFVQALLNVFPAHKVERAVEEYYLGTAQSLTGANKSVVFWFVDRCNNIRAGQVKEFDANCKTLSFQIGEERIKAYWVHRLLSKYYRQQGKAFPEWLQSYLNQDKYLTCLFGEHLLVRYPSKPVALVEAPKTAVIASMVYPDYIWLATTSLSYLTKERCTVLRGRNVVLFPDCGIPNKNNGLTCLDVWRDRVSEFNEIANFEFSTLLEERSTPKQKEDGFDLADFILQEMSSAPIEITASDIDSMPVLTKTGEEFGNMIMAFVKLKDGRYYDILFSNEGELICSHPCLPALEQFFERSFKPGTIDGQSCLINNVE